MMKHNYSCGSLAAADTLEALMRHAAPPGSGCCGMMLGSGQQGIMSQAMKQQFVNGGAAPMQSFLGSACSQSGLDPMACSAAFGASSEGYSQALDRIEFSQGALPILMRGAGEPQRSAQLEHSGFGRGALGVSFAGGVPGQPGCSMQNVASPLSMLYHGANATLGHNQVASSGPVVSGDQMSDGQQKRRFVWSPELHSRFEAAVNALGLDAAKPKSILRLMNVEGLTKANIKSHLQKYRCLMQKRASSVTTSQPSTAPVSASGEASRDSSPAEIALPAITMCTGALPGAQSLPASAPSAASGSATCANMMDLSALSSSDQRQAALPEAIMSQDGCSLQRNLEVQEMTLKVQMDLQEELSRQLQLQKRLQTEMECMMNARAAEAKAMDESSATSSKMNNILALKHKLQHELQAHLRMQHQLLSQLNQVVLPVIGGDALSGGAAPPGSSAAAAAVEPSMLHDDGEEDGGEDDEGEEEDGGEDDEVEEEECNAKRLKLTR